MQAQSAFIFENSVSRRKTAKFTATTLAPTGISSEYEKTIPLDMYDFEKANGRDPYEFFLSGNRIVLKIENPAVKDGRRLILFRDSFGSSLAPYLVP